MNQSEFRAELRGLYARAVNELNCTPLGYPEKRRLRERIAWNLREALDALEAVEKTSLRPLPHIAPLPVQLARLQPVSKEGE